mgnify:CR=1 FL=1
MNCLNIDVNKLTKKKLVKIRNFEYNFLDLLLKYKMPINIYYNYLLSLEIFKLKNIWNNLVKKWNHMKNELKDNILFQNSEYSKIEYHQIHENINDEKLNKLLNDFIDNNDFKGLFISNIIQKIIIPK